MLYKIVLFMFASQKIDVSRKNLMSSIYMKQIEEYLIFVTVLLNFYD